MKVGLLVLRVNLPDLEDDLNPYNATGFYLYPVKTSENQRFSNVFSGL